MVGSAAPALLGRRLLFVTGKGGVGRTTIAAALALVSASRGRRTLVCDAGGTGDLARVLGIGDPFGYRPEAIGAHLSAMAIDTEAALREYLQLYLRLPVVARLGPLARALDFVAQAAPGVREILTIGKLAHEVRQASWDLIVVDAAPSGHVVSQLAAADLVGGLAQAGPLRAQTGWVRGILADPAQTGVVVVTIPEELPVAETIELIGEVEARTDVDVGAVVANRVLPALFNRVEAEAFASLQRAEVRSVLEAEVGPGAAGVLDGAALAGELRRRSSQHLANLRGGLSGLPVVLVPDLVEHGPAGLAERVAAGLADELS